MSVANDIDWTNRGNEDICISRSEEAKNFAKRFSQGYWTFVGLGDET